LLIIPNPADGKVTREVVESYMAHGRYLKSLYVVGLLRRLGHWPKIALSRFAGWFGASLGLFRASERSLAMRNKGEVCRHRH